MSDGDATSLEEAVRWELVLLWSDMTRAREEARDGGWSIGCVTTAARIVELSKFVGATPWKQVDVAVLRDGTYEKVLGDAGLKYAPIDWDRVARCQQVIAGARADRR